MKNGSMKVHLLPQRQSTISSKYIKIIFLLRKKRNIKKITYGLNNKKIVDSIS